MEKHIKKNRGADGALTHPPQEEWMAFLYGEVEAPAKQSLQAHLKACPECAQKISDWRSSMRTLSRWRLPDLAPVTFGGNTLVRWAAAAVVVLGLGFLGGRLSYGLSSTDRLRAEIESSVRGSLEKQNRQLVREYTQAAMTALNQKAVDDLRVVLLDDLHEFAQDSASASEEQIQRVLAAYDDRQKLSQTAILTALRTLEERQRGQAASLASLRKDLETVAVNTESGLDKTHQQLVQLAGASERPSPLSTQ